MTLVGIKAKTKFEERKLKAKVEKANFKNLKHASGAIRLTARRSIRRSKKPSKPGSPPHTPTGHLKRVIAYDVNEASNEAVIGPVNEYSRSIWNLHEFGGTVQPKPKLLKEHTFQVGEYGPIRRTGKMARDRRGRFARRSKTFARVQLKTKAQARRATAIVANENRLRVADSKKTRRYPKRPFMGPALAKMQDRLPQHWKNSVHD
jgi:hypothetical protein